MGPHKAMAHGLPNEVLVISLPMAPEASCSLPYVMGLCRGHVGHVWLVCFDGSWGVNGGVNINVHTCGQSVEV